jgi:hypothetical protein
MIPYACDRCKGPLPAAAVWHGRIENLTEGPIRFELCGRCVAELRDFVFSRAEGSPESAAAPCAGAGQKVIRFGEG